MKFVANRAIIQGDSEFMNIDEAKNAPLAVKLFHFAFVKLYCKKFCFYNKI